MEAYLDIFGRQCIAAHKYEVCITENGMGGAIIAQSTHVGNARIIRAEAHIGMGDTPIESESWVNGRLIRKGFSA